MKKRKTVRYTEAFRRQVVSEIESGKYETAHAASRAYGIGGGNTVRNWVDRYGSEALQSRVVHVRTRKERDELKATRKRVKDLEAALSDAHVDFSLEHAYLDLACEKLGMDLADFKKKHAMTLSDVRRRKAGVR